MNCGHFEYLDSRAVGGWSIRTCSNCGMRLEPANDTPAVMIEIRAAEIADTSIEVFDCYEFFGWIEHEFEYTSCGPANPSEWAGWLARQISTHGDESENSD